MAAALRGGSSQRGQAMTALLSILALLTLAAGLRVLERGEWPPQRHEALYDSGYWQAVKADSLAYLATHKNISAQIHAEIDRTIAKADQRLQRVGSAQ